MLLVCQIEQHVVLNVRALIEFLNAQRDSTNLYMVRLPIIGKLCIKVADLPSIMFMWRIKQLSRASRLEQYLHPILHETRKRCFQGCMKSGEVVTNRRKQWYEPEHWRFGDPAGQNKILTYHRHAQSHAYGLSDLVAKYIAQNAELLHRFEHEDVTLGAWLLGLSIVYKDEPRLCCNGADCKFQDPDLPCIASFDPTCLGPCIPRSLQELYQRCVEHNR